MPPISIHTAPKIDDYTSLADYQSQTPSTFHDTKHVIHYTGDNFRALGHSDQVSSLKIFEVPILTYEDGGWTEEAVGIFVTSENLILWSSRLTVGLSIPYPSISLHAIQRMPDPSNKDNQLLTLYMQLSLSDPNAMDAEEEEEEDISYVEINLISSSPEPETDIKSLFEAISACSNLHPDPDEGDEEDADGTDDRIRFEGNVGYEGISGIPGMSEGVNDGSGSLPPPFPGSGGWITAENVDQFFDAEGNYLQSATDANDTLGEGAGRTRGIDEVDGDGVNGEANGVEDLKWRRTE